MIASYLPVVYSTNCMICCHDDVFFVGVVNTLFLFSCFLIVFIVFELLIPYVAINCRFGFLSLTTSHYSHIATTLPCSLVQGCGAWLSMECGKPQLLDHISIYRRGEYSELNRL